MKQEVKYRAYIRRPNSYGMDFFSIIVDEPTAEHAIRKANEQLFESEYVRQQGHNFIQAHCLGAYTIPEAEIADKTVNKQTAPAKKAKNGKIEAGE